MPDEPRSRHEVVSDRAAALAYCASRGVNIGDAPDIRGICQLRDGKVIGAALFQDFNGSNIWLHLAGEDTQYWLTRQFLHNIFAYPFVTLGARRISLWIEATNAASIRLVRHAGFHFEATLAQAARSGDDVEVWAMFRDTCRYA